MESKHAAVDGIRMRWEEEGAGLPVVLLHGIPTSPRLWRHVVPRLERVRALAWEMVGYGESIPEGRRRDISLSRQTSYLAGWMREIDIRGAVVVGHDLGGGVAQILAVRHPELVSGLVLTNSIGYDAWPVPIVKAMRAMAPAIAGLPDEAIRQMFRVFLWRGHDNRYLARESLDVHWGPYAGTDASAALVHQIEPLEARDTRAVADRLPGLDLPARLVWGAADGFLKIGLGYRLAHDLGAPLERIETGKHFVPEDHPEPVAAAITEVSGRARKRLEEG